MSSQLIHTLSDGDAATISDLAEHRRAKIRVSAAERETQIAEAYEDLAADAAHRAETVERYLAARKTGVSFDELRVLADAKRYDNAHPGEPSLLDECHAVALFSAQPTEYGEVA